MHLLEASYKSALGRFRKNLVLCLMIFFCSFFSIIGFYFTYMSDAYRTEIYNRESELINSGNEENVMELIEDTDNSAWQYSGVAELLFNVSDYMLTGIYCTMFLVIILTYIIWIKDMSGIIGIYIVMGESKIRVVLRIIAENMCFTPIAVISGTAAGSFFVNNCGSGLLLNLREWMGYSYYSPLQELDEFVLYYNLPLGLSVISAGCVLLITLIISVIVSSGIVNKRLYYLFD